MTYLQNRFDALENESIEINIKKTCKECNKEKDLNEFYVGRRKCKECYIKTVHSKKTYVKKEKKNYEMF